MNGGSFLMHDMADHSFALLAYMDSPYLGECLHSLKQQTVRSTIYICTSTPSEYIRQFARENELELHIMETRKGMSHDWNFGLAMAKTKYVTLAHQDDLYLPTYTEECIAAAAKFDDTLICFTDYIEYVDNRDRTDNQLLRIKRIMLKVMMPFYHLRSPFWKTRMLSFGDPVAAPSIMYVCDRLNGFSYSTDFIVGLDWEGLYRLAKMKGRFVYINRPLIRHRIHPDSATTSAIQDNARHREDLILFKRFWPGFIAKILARLYAQSHKSNAI
jgi:glycosyltransferase involved in cell wall biosynthesis